MMNYRPFRFRLHSFVHNQPIPTLGPSLFEPDTDEQQSSPEIEILEADETTLTSIFMVTTIAWSESAFVGEDSIGNDVLQSIRVHQDQPQEEEDNYLLENAEEHSDPFEWQTVQMRLGLQRPTEGEVIRTFRPRQNVEVRTMYHLHLVKEPMTSRNVMGSLEMHWNDIGPYPHHFNEWSLQQV